ncbi:adhesin related protein (plasmid) [Spiroplasma kunkelii CR2-3x]|uniref:Adhesin related protein n=1 Tax=Spiroplasma kunkelii CR2-3x TaxID=273035 RepID=A0A0K2JJY7_SPIKU|nr:two-component regulator propeller domain-containing protein [Spiroplasma kunkelii]ALA98581.1 adhesin related protein [Spiroplasma kunkelii CR2-3x]
MKKLLSILTITTLTTSTPAPLLAAVPLTNTLTSNSNNEYLSIKEMNGVNNNINSITIDKNNNIYFGTDTGAYKLFAGSTTPTKINGISGNVVSIAVWYCNGNVSCNYRYKSDSVNV